MAPAMTRATIPRMTGSAFLIAPMQARACPQSRASGNRLEHRAQAQRLAAERAPGTAHVVPGESVEVRPGHVLGDEVIEEERGHDGARHSTSAAVVEIRDVRIE